MASIIGLEKNSSFGRIYTGLNGNRKSILLSLKNHWNIGISYQLNEYVNLATQFLHGDQLSFTATLAVNPSRPPLLGGKELVRFQ